MRIPILSLALFLIIGALPATLAADYKEWVAQGYRWSSVSGLHAYLSKDDAKKERSRHDKSSVSEKVRYAYYLRPGKIVLVIGTDTADGLSEIRMGGITSDLWTATKNLSMRPVKNAVGKIETPETAGIMLPTASATPGLSSGGREAAPLGASPRSTSAK